MLTLDIIRQLLPKIEQRPISLVTVGYPDTMVPAEMVGEMFGQDILGGLEYREDSADIIEWHKMTGALDKVIETKSLLEALGIQMTVLDIAEVRGGEIVCDLNEPAPESLHNRFDIVLDGGTLEHCFNVGQAMNNLVGFAKPNGFIIHGNPLFSMNHGFFNFCPTFYHDYYADNGHKLVAPIFGFVNDGFNTKKFGLPHTGRFGGVPEESWISVVAKKVHTRRNQWPVQTKYKVNPGLV